MPQWWTRFRTRITGRSTENDDFAEEIQAHLEMQMEDRLERGLARGLTPEQARSDAMREFGNRTRIAELARESWTFPGLDSLTKDVRYALRNIRRSPSFSTIVVLTLALGIGLNTAIFSVVHTVLLKPLPYPQSERLVRFGEATAQVKGMSVSWVNFQNWRSSNRTFEEMAGYKSIRLTLTGHGEPITTRGLTVTSSYFGLLGMRPLLGRLFDANDDRPGAVPTVVLNHGFWLRSLGGDPKVVGTALTLDGKTYDVAGVAEPVWESRSSDYYLPLGLLEGATVDRGAHDSTRILGRLKPGVTISAAREDLDRVMAHLATTDPGPEKDHTSYGTFLTEEVTGNARQPMLVLLGAAALVLLIACANVGALLLARNSARAGEFGVRTAIGAGQFRLLRQLLTENLVLATIGGICGVLLAHWTLGILLMLAPGEIPRLSETSINSTVLLFAFLLTIATGLFAGFAPAFIARKVDVSSLMKDGARSTGGGRRHHSVRSILVIAEVALTLVLAFGSGLLLQSLIAAQHSRAGYDPKGILAADVSLPDTTYKTGASRLEFYDRLRTNLRSIPGVQNVAIVRCAPGRGSCGDWFYSVLGGPAPARNEVPLSLFNVADPGYFQLLRIPLLQGRLFDARDTGKGVAVAIVNETLARRWWPNRSAIGQQIKVGGPYMDGGLLEIVGVVGDVKQEGLDSVPYPEIYEPLPQSISTSASFMIRGSGDPEGLANAVRRKVASLDPNMPVQRITTLEAALGDSLARRRFSTMLLSLFAGLAMVLAVVGIYGMLSYWVNIREPEIAVRLALGARPGAILRWASSHALKLAAVGLVFGGVGAWVVARVIEDQIFGIPSRDPATLIAAVLAVGLISILGAALPAWRASRVDAGSRLYRA